MENFIRAQRVRKGNNFFMSSLTIFLAILGVGFLGILAGAACMMSSIYTHNRGGCEECGKGCETINIYCGKDSMLEICECECDDDESDSDSESDSKPEIND